MKKKGKYEYIIRLAVKGKVKWMTAEKDWSTRIRDAYRYPSRPAAISDAVYGSSIEVAPDLGPTFRRISFRELQQCCKHLRFAHCCYEPGSERITCLSQPCQEDECPIFKTFRNIKEKS